MPHRATSPHRLISPSSPQRPAGPQRQSARQRQPVPQRRSRARGLVSRRPPTGLRRLLGTLIAAGLAIAPMTVLAASAGAAPQTGTGGSLSWGVKQSFRDYVRGPVAAGSISAQHGASFDGSTAAFPLAAGSADSGAPSADSRFSGALHFVGHASGGVNLLDLTLSNPRIVVAGSSGTLYLDYAGLTFPAGTPTGGTARTAAAPGEIPLVSITALLGGPFFFWMILRTRSAGRLGVTARLPAWVGGRLPAGSGPRVAPALHPGRGRHRLPERPPSGLAAQTRALSIKRGERLVLSDVELGVRYGEALALVGPNGAGKSTLLAALAGDLHPDGGAVELDGAPIQDWTAKELAWRRAVLPQHAGLAFPFQVSDVVMMGRAPWAGCAQSGDDEAIVAEAMRRCSCGQYAHRRVPSLSGGELARVALARALAQQAPLLLLDEPTAALDLRHQELVLQIAVEQANRGDAVVVVLHDLDLAGAYADRIAMLADGGLRALGPPADVLTGELLTAVYQYPVDVLAHPGTGEPIVLPRRIPRTR